ncbi:hypothetical protein EDC04DRAFT_3091088 [Pisolithus marmoratus]|nr:hypothetical protein EDC04DRAFT_3091088 [Pisolithus marmoratus]
MEPSILVSRSWSLALSALPVILMVKHLLGSDRPSRRGGNISSLSPCAATSVSVSRLFRRRRLALWVPKGLGHSHHGPFSSYSEVSAWERYKMTLNVKGVPEDHPLRKKLFDDSERLILAHQDLWVIQDGISPTTRYAGQLPFSATMRIRLGMVVTNSAINDVRQHRERKTTNRCWPPTLLDETVNPIHLLLGSNTDAAKLLDQLPFTFL